MRSMKKRFSVGWLVGIAFGFACTTFAGSVSDTFTTGGVLTAAQMTNIKSAVNDNDTRVTGLQTGTGACAGNPAVTGDTMVRVGSTCVDKYEASIGGGGEAQSVANVAPATGVDWFAAADACAKAGKRLLTNAEWQTAAAGTPDNSTGGCNGGFAAVGNTGTFAGCVSSYGVADMVGNVSEWVADWDKATASGDVSSDTIGKVRGGDANDVATANFLEGGLALNSTGTKRGFRCGR